MPTNEYEWRRNMPSSKPHLFLHVLARPKPDIHPVCKRQFVGRRNTYRIPDLNPADACGDCLAVLARDGLIVHDPSLRAVRS